MRWGTLPSPSGGLPSDAYVRKEINMIELLTKMNYAIFGWLILLLAIFTSVLLVKAIIFVIVTPVGC